jgi:hypothetical protein
VLINLYLLKQSVFNSSIKTKLANHQVFVVY